MVLRRWESIAGDLVLTTISRSNKGLTLETSAFLRWLIYIFNPVVNTKLPVLERVEMFIPIFGYRHLIF